MLRRKDMQTEAKIKAQTQEMKHIEPQVGVIHVRRNIQHLPV